MSNLDLYISILNNVKRKNEALLKETTLSKIDFFDKNLQSYGIEISKYYYKDYKQYFQSALSQPTNENRFLETSTHTSQLSLVVTETIGKYSTFKEELDEPFKIFVMGTGNYGKSALINSLIGTQEKHAKEKVTPETWRIDQYKYSANEDTVIIKYKDGESSKFSKEEAIKKLNEEEEKTKESKAQTRKVRKSKRKELSKEQLKELTRKLESEEYTSNISEVVWGVSDSLSLKKFTIVDTPGLTQKNFGEIKHSAREYYDLSDGVLWLLDATAISSKNSKEMMDEINLTMKDMGGRKSKREIIGILNKIDLIPENEQEKVIKEAEKLFDGYFEKIIPYSATEAYDSTILNDLDQMEKSGKLQLIRSIESIFFSDATKKKCELKVEDTVRLNEHIKNEVSSFNSKIYTDWNKLVDGIENLTQETEGIMNRTEEEIIKEINWVINKASSNMDYHFKKLNNITENERPQYVNEIFLPSALLSKLNRIMRRMQEELVEFTNSIILQNHITQYPTLVEPLYLDRIEMNSDKLVGKNIDLDIKNVADNAFAGAALGALFGPGGVLFIGGLSILWSKFSNNKKKEQVLDAGKEALSEMHHELAREIEFHSFDIYSKSRIQLIQSFCDQYFPKETRFRDINDIDKIMEDLRKIFKLTNEENNRFVSVHAQDINRFNPTVKELLVTQGGKKIG